MSDGSCTRLLHELEDIAHRTLCVRRTRPNGAVENVVTLPKDISAALDQMRCGTTEEMTIILVDGGGKSKFLSSLRLY